MIKKHSAILAAGIGAALILTGCSNDNDNSSDSAASAASSSTWTTPAAPTVDMSRFGALPAVPTPAAPTVECSYIPDGQAAKPVQMPNATGIADAGATTLTLTTNQGPIGLTLDRAKAPCTVNSLVSLSEQGYFDNTPCHRISTTAPLQMLQCGDPSGSGAGGPGYRYANEYPTTAYAPTDPALDNPVVYPRGTVAMAHSQLPDSNGSQFFLVYADSVLPPQYTVLGTIDEAGLATIEKVAVAGDDGSSPAGGGAPKTPVTIETAKVG